MSFYYKVGLLQKVKAHLKSGGIIAYPTESCYGLGCDPFNYKAINTLIKLKRRKKDKGLILIAGKFKQLGTIIQPLTKEQFKKTKQYWPGVYSLIMDTQPNVMYNLTGKHKTIAVRLTLHKNVIQLCNFVNSAIVSTSANKTNMKTIKTYRECSRQFGTSVLVLPSITNFVKKPSTIIDLKTNKILRN